MTCPKAKWRSRGRRSWCNRRASADATHDSIAAGFFADHVALDSMSRIQRLRARSRTDFPLPSVSFVLTPNEMNSLMIRRCAASAASLPLPPRPVLCTAR